MRSLTVLLLTLTFSLSLTAQFTKKVTEKKGWYTEVYSVLKSDNTTRHGLYQKFTGKKNLYVNGYYHFGAKDSLWTHYFRGSDSARVLGYYRHNRQDGIWRYYGAPGLL